MNRKKQETGEVFTAWFGWSPGFGWPEGADMACPHLRTCCDIQSGASNLLRANQLVNWLDE